MNDAIENHTIITVQLTFRCYSEFQVRTIATMGSKVSLLTNRSNPEESSPQETAGMENCSVKD